MSTMFERLFKCYNCGTGQSVSAHDIQRIDITTDSPYTLASECTFCSVKRKIKITILPSGEFKVSSEKLPRQWDESRYRKLRTKEI